MNEPLGDITMDTSLSTELRVDSVCRRFEAAWKTGEQPLPEDFTTGWEGEDRLVLLRELILIDMDYRKRAGETPSPDDYQRHFTPSMGSVVSQGVAIPHGAAVPTDEVLPRPFGRYMLRRLLGKGGMGRVYLAHDSQLDRLVALKMPTLVEGVAGWRDRFLTEARSAATLSHPNVCPVHDVGEVAGQPYLTMAYIEGETLSQKLARDGRLAPTEAVELVRTVARAMQEAHRRGIVHRDLKPANLMLDSNDRPIIMDFGLAIRSTATDDLRLTLTGVALGTPAYMPPEQAGGDNDSIGPSADVYSLGVVLYELVTGRTPFTAKSFGKLLAMIERDPPPSPVSLNPDVDPPLEAVILTALAKLPAERFANAGDLADALDEYLEGDRRQVLSRYSKVYRVPDATGEYRPAPTAASTAAFRKQRRWVRWVAGVTALLVFALAGAAIYVETDYGQLVIQISDANAKVDVTVNGQEVTLDPGGGRSVRVRSGPNQKLVVTGPDFKTVADTYEVTRGNATLARVTLVPKEGKVQTVPPEQKSEDTSKTTLPSTQPKSSPKVDSPSKKPDPPKPTPYPARSTIVEIPGWQILADATREEMNQWIAERKKLRHTVTWIDSTMVAGKPLFAAVAALDERQPGWNVLFDVHANASTATALRPRINMEANYIVAGGSYEVDHEPLAVLLWWPGSKRFAVVANMSTLGMKRDMPEVIADGYMPRVLRANAASDGVTRWLAYHSVDAKNKTEYSLELTTEELITFLNESRHKDMMPVSIGGWLKDELPLFSAIVTPLPAKWEWRSDTSLTTAEFTAKAADMAAIGFQPSCVTAYPWDGAVRYCAVWVKEPLKPVEYPKGPTLIEMPGWQIYVDATKEEMKSWLDDRKKDKHSAIWLDAVQVGDRPVFSAIAATDDRSPNWKAFLDTPVNRFGSGEMAKEVSAKSYHPLSSSGYLEGGSIKSVTLWRNEFLPFYLDPEATPTGLKIADEQLSQSGGVVRSIRPFHAGTVTAMGMFGHKALGEKGTYLLEGMVDQLTDFVKSRQQAGDRITSFAALEKDGRLFYTIVGATNPEKIEWKLDHGLTAGQLKAKNAELRNERFHPACVTAFPWDGAVRYCVVWVKEAPK